MTKPRFFPPEQLSAIRANCDWRKLLSVLGVRADLRRCTETEFWGFSPFNPNEKTASFHVKEPGLWYCWSTHAKAPGRDRPGGGVIELVQAVHATRGQIMKLNEAAAFLVQGGYAPIGDAAPAKSDSDEGRKENAPIDIDLVPKLSLQGEHPAFVNRGISEETCRYLRCGYYQGKRSALSGRIVFQVGGVSENGKSRTIISHVGRATTPEQEEKGKWRYYRGFNPSLELYNLDNLLLDEEAREQAKATDRIVLVEGAFDVAKCVEAGIKNVAASFGARLYGRQAERLGDALSRLSASTVVVFYDRDAAGEKASAEALALLQERSIPATAFDWDQEFTGANGKSKAFPETIQDPCDFRVGQLRWLRERGVV